jgi:fermentation-respiration switch protein FrsA (DUF1100 family)
VGDRLAAVENGILYHPQRFPAGDWVPEPGVEDVWVNSSGDVRLHGWLARAEQPRAVVLYAHGNAGNVTGLRPILHLFRDQLNATVLVFDYRGYGRSEGSPNEAGVLDDARAARRWLAETCGVRESDIVLVGYSLGGGVAVDLATDGARGLVLQSTFSSVPDVAVSHFPLLPARLVMRTRFDSAAKIRTYRGPLLQVHGDADTVVPYSSGRRLFEAANEPKKFITVAGGDHTDPPTEEYVRALDQFLDSLRVRGR